MIVIFLFNLLFRYMSSFRGVRRTAVQMPMLTGSRGGFFSVSEAADAVSRVHIVELAGLPAPPTSHTLHLYPFHLSLPFPFPDYTAGDLEILPGLS